MANEQKKTSMPASRTSQTVKILTAGAVLLVLAGLVLTGTIVLLVLATPVFVVFSPVLVPVAIVLFLVVGGLVVAVSTVAWTYSYVARNCPPWFNWLSSARRALRKWPPWSDWLESAKRVLARKAHEVKEKARS